MLGTIDFDFHSFSVQGRVEAEFELLTKEDAEASPAGKGREEPQALAKPKYVISDHYENLQG